MLIEFKDVRSAVTASFAILDLVRTANAEQSDAEPIALRAGLHVGEFLSDQRDIYGSSANLAARLCGLAGRTRSSSRPMSAIASRIRWTPTSMIWAAAT